MWKSHRVFFYFDLFLSAHDSDMYHGVAALDPERLNVFRTIRQITGQFNTITSQTQSHTREFHCEFICFVVLSLSLWICVFVLMLCSCYCCGFNCLALSICCCVFNLLCFWIDCSVIGFVVVFWLELLCFQFYCCIFALMVWSFVVFLFRCVFGSAVVLLVTVVFMV